jgi:poly(glycerol-phosphate) alpha-glucosyltransferase
MHAICLLESVSRTDGGIFEAECALQRELFMGQRIQVDVVGIEDQFTAQDASRWLPLKASAVKTRGPGALGYSPDLLATMDSKADLLYAATLWKYPSWAALQWAERTRKPLMVAPHGSLDIWALKNAAWKKRIAAVLFKDRQLRKASCIRALCHSEAEAIRAYGLTNPIAIIPNGVNLPEGDVTKTEAGDRKKLLFLGRIHPKKGIPNLIRAFAQSRVSRDECREPWQLVIAGWDQGGHEAELMKLCEELGLKSKKLKVEGEKVASDIALDSGLSTLDAEIIFFGPAFGGDKKLLLRTADAFVLPSFSEGLPMSVLEAWSYQLPVVMTPECNLPEGFAADAAIRIETGAESITQGLDTLFSMSASDLQAMGAKGRALVEERFTWKTIAAQMREVYDWMLGGGAKPGSMTADR